MKSRKITGIAMTVLLAGSLLACGNQGTSGGGQEAAPGGNKTKGEGEVTRISAQTRDNGDGTMTSVIAEYPVAEELDDTLMQGVNHLAYCMSEQLAVDGGNYFFSPYSISSALTLLDNAAEGETKEQMEELLGISDLQNWNMQLSCYMAKEQPEEAMLTSANSLWFDRQFCVSDRAYEEYLPLVEFYYDAQLYQADFYNDPAGTKDQINQWIADETNGMIEDYLKEVDSKTVLALFNAVYFYGEWSFPFMAEMTYSDVFHGTSGDTQADMMHQSEIWLSYYEADNLRGISLPYGDGSKVMNILLPSEGSGATAAQLFAELSEDEKNEFLRNVMDAKESYVEMLQLPKYSMSYSVQDFKKVLEDIGMTDAFNPVLAQFPGIGEIYVSDAGHMAVLEVDELGSRAAAVTSMMADECALVMEENPVRFVVDQPFVFFIQDKETGMILFMGQVSELS